MTEPKPFRIRLKDSLPDWAKWIIPLIVACITFYMLSPGKPHYRATYDPSQPVQVSSYTRSDGTVVSGYNRSEPGDRAAAEAINEPIKTANRKETRRVKEGAKFAIIIAAFAFWMSRVYLTYDK